ncbi:hypothetical protein HanRHA438_Chr17g0824381 [Helianthus annuus]|nr:hypothetical protein HanRHA438_Chr17g0824381 [Helianthus annuus]
MRVIKRILKCKKLKEHNNMLSYDYKKMKEAYDVMNRKTNEFITLVQKQHETNEELKITVKDKQLIINKFIDDIVDLKQQLEQAKIQTERVNSTEKLMSLLHSFDNLFDYVYYVCSLL